ncbi:MAG: hypothetical protein PHF86_08525 [Candidatus Nanoarchaeia archaeon]|jgi:tRNA (cmo5U34)-methyltransferase|nr:hypothetical protein [Candidatus Nanoarchaeia archaeon]
MFDFNTINNFDDHINKSIPGYSLLIDLIKSMSEYFYIEDMNIYDLGCSTGKLLKSLDTKCKKIGIDNSNLLPQETNFLNDDLNNISNLDNACIIYSIFTMQFLQPYKKYHYLKTIYNSLIKNGVLFLCEKVYQPIGKVQEIFSFSFYDFKSNNFTIDELFHKERDLRLNMKLLYEQDIINMIKDIGFSSITLFWQILNFKGYLIIK